MNMKKNLTARRLAAIVLAGLMCFGIVAMAVTAILAAIPAKAAEAAWEATASDPLVTSKEVYVEGEPVMVKAYGSGKDWVAIYEINDLFPNIGSIYWYYVADYPAGEAVNIRGICEPGQTQTDLGRKGLPAGEYKVILFSNDGYEVLKQVNISVVKASETEAPTETETWEPDETNRIVTSKEAYEEGEPILVKAVGTGDQWVGIYKTSDTPPANGSIYWYYVDKEGHASGEEVNIKDTNPPGDHQAAYKDLPAGEYKLILYADGGYTIDQVVYITVKASPSNRPTKPASAVYASAHKGKGRADGTLTIKHDGNEPTSYVLRWANIDGPIKGYTDIATVACTGETTTVTMTPYTLIPAGADRILVYAQKSNELSETPAVAMLSKDAGNYDLGEVHQELQVMSDIHLNDSSDHPYNQQFAAALREITELSPNTLGVFVNGDVADLGLASNYAAYQKILKTAGKALDVYASMGNHDFYCNKYGGPNLTDAEKIAQFLKGTGNDSETVYFDRWIDGTHFVFLGSEAYVPPNAQLSDAQLNWLEETLEKDKAEGRPVFLFLHEGIMDTVAGTMEYQGWHGVEQGQKLKAIIDAHPEVILFSGHSHWVLESPVTILPGEGKAATHVSTSSCAYLWDDNANITNIGINGSQGWYIYLYDNCIVLRGRSFSTGEWISSAQFVLDWDFGDAWGTETDETTPTETTPADTVPTDTVPPDTVPADTVPAESIPAESDAASEDASAPSDTAPTTDAPDSTGCASAMGVCAVSVILMGGVCALTLRRRREE